MPRPESDSQTRRGARPRAAGRQGRCPPQAVASLQAEGSGSLVQRSQYGSGLGTYRFHETQCQIAPYIPI